MRLQRTYIGYCAVTWALWAFTLALSLFSGGAYDVRNEVLYPFALKFSSISLFVSLVPLHPVLFVCALIYSIKNKREGYTSFNAFAVILSTILALGVLANHVYLTGGV